MKTMLIVSASLFLAGQLTANDTPPTGYLPYTKTATLHVCSGAIATTAWAESPHRPPAGCAEMHVNQTNSTTRVFVRRLGPFSTGTQRFDLYDVIIMPRSGHKLEGFTYLPSTE